MRQLCLVLVCLFALLANAHGADTARLPSDQARDQRERPEALLDFAGVEAGMVVADVFGGGGYYSEWLQSRVGDGGQVLLFNSAGYQAFAQKDLDSRFADGRLAQIERRVADAAAMGLGDARFDRILMVMALHDVYWVDDQQGWPAIDRAGFIAQLVRALKPGGALLIVDHASIDGRGSDDVNRLHRIDEAFVRSELEAAGLQFAASSDGWRNPQDPRSALVFDEAIRGRTDRFVHLYRKPR